MLGIIVGERTAGDSPEMANPSWQSCPVLAESSPSCAAGSGPAHHMSRKSQSLGEVWRDQLIPAPGSGVFPRPPQDLPHLPREHDQPELVGHGHSQFSAHQQPYTGSWLSLEMFSGGFAGQLFTITLPSSSTSLGFAATAQGEAVPSPVRDTGQELGSSGLCPGLVPHGPTHTWAFPSPPAPALDIGIYP